MNTYFFYEMLGERCCVEVDGNTTVENFQKGLAEATRGQSITGVRFATEAEVDHLLRTRQPILRLEQKWMIRVLPPTLP